MKIDQICFYCSTEAAGLKVKRFFNLEHADWIQDKVTARSIFGNQAIPPSENIAELQFNYDLGIELEILRYVSGPSWHWTNPLNREPQFISHVGIHLHSAEDFPDSREFPLVQETFTQSHTGEYLTKPGSPGYGRKYHYKIFEMSPGSYIKYIRRIVA